MRWAYTFVLRSICGANMLTDVDVLKSLYFIQKYKEDPFI